MFSTAPKTEPAMRRVFKDTYGMGSFALESVVAWAVKRGAAAGGEGPDSAPNRAVSKAAIDALAKAEREGILGDDRMDMVQRALDLAEKEAPALQGKSPFARALHLHGNDSGLLGGDAAALAKAGVADSVAAVENEEGGKLMIKGTPYYLNAVHFSSYAAWCEYEASNKVAAREYKYYGLVEQISER
jgi:hypothetical protein